jgi:hypothetical protein
VFRQVWDTRWAKRRVLMSMSWSTASRSYWGSEDNVAIVSLFLWELICDVGDFAVDVDS